MGLALLKEGVTSNRCFYWLLCFSQPARLQPRKRKGTVKVNHNNPTMARFLKDEMPPHCLAVKQHITIWSSATKRILWGGERRGILLLRGVVSLLSGDVKNSDLFCVTSMFLSAFILDFGYDYIMITLLTISSFEELFAIYRV
jgi:hypothetical protein